MATPPSAAVIAQTNAAQQAVRRSVDGLGRPGATADQSAASPNRAAVSYSRDVLPILQANCHGCHSPDKLSGGFDMTTFDNFVRGGESGAPAVVPSDPDASFMIQQITPVGGRAAMPKRKPPLAANQIALIRRWVEEGATNDDSQNTTREAYGADPRGAYGPPSGTTEAKYISPTAIAVVTIRPAQIMSAPIAELLPLEVLKAAGEQYLGFDPAGVEEVTIFLDQLNLIGPTHYGLTFKFSQPFRAASIPQHWRAGAQLGELAGKRYLQSASPSPFQPSFFGPDNRTLVVAPDAMLRRLVEASGQSPAGPLAERLASAPAGSDLYVAIDVVSLRPMIEMSIAQWKTVGKVPAEAEKFLELPKLIAAAELTFNLTPSGPMSLVLHAPDEQAAQQLETIMAEASNIPAADAASPYGAANPYAADPVGQAMTQFVERFSQPFRPQRTGTRVTLFRVEANSPMQQQLAALAVFGVGVGVQAAQAASAAAEGASASPADAEAINPTEAEQPATTSESGSPEGYQRPR